ncbi:MAG: hypothetical protein H6625_03655 [Bdellovibrionaceae bacterium]|nr:hypothetical protein [Pseudobdellovibrionaceae bacterium]
MIKLDIANKPNVDIKIKKALKTLLEDKKYGFLKVLNSEFKWAELNDFKTRLKTYDQVAVLGIGGSSQGAKSFLQYIDPGAVDTDVVFFDRIDESFISRQLSKIKSIKKTAWFVVSKSGSTTETLFTLNTILNKTEGQLLQNKENIFVVTEKMDSILGQWAAKHGLSVSPAASDIEGRFSLFSHTGMMPLANKINNFENIKMGTQWLEQNLSVVEELSQFYIDSFKQERWISNFWLYSERLKELGFWLEQLWAESLGKHNKMENRISTPFCCLGTNDQHSLLQQMEEGYPDKSQVFVQIKSTPELSRTYNKNWLGSGANYLESYQLDDLMKKYCLATYDSLDEHPRAMITLQDTSEAVIFAFHMVIALTIGTIGKALDIEIYGQPGVEKSKQLFREML